jgi:tRNA (guanosine-2'-O-)-methyltransferase
MTKAVRLEHLERKKQIFALFSQYVTPERAAKIQQMSTLRTRYVTVVLEDIFQPHNTSAALRSCECFGVQDVYVVEQRHQYKIFENIAKGASQWLDIKQFNQKDVNNTQACFQDLKRNNYTIVATTPHARDLLIDQVPIDTKIALVFGTEQEGLSQYALDHADRYAKIPLYGFTESFNISVSVAICLYEITKRLHAGEYNWQLTPEEMLDLQLDWLGRTTHRYTEIQELVREIDRKR